MHLDRLKGHRFGLSSYTYPDWDHQGQVCPNMVKNTEDTYNTLAFNVSEKPQVFI